MLRKMASNKLQTQLQIRCYICSLSAHVVVYKVIGFGLYGNNKLMVQSSSLFNWLYLVVSVK